MSASIKKALEARIQQILGKALADAHPKQGALFGERTLPIVHLTQALHALGVYVTSTTREALQAVQHRHPVVPLLLQWKGLEKFESSFGKNLLSYVTSAGRIHATFEQVGAASGRIICREPNLQQIQAH